MHRDRGWRQHFLETYLRRVALRRRFTAGLMDRRAERTSSETTRAVLQSVAGVLRDRADHLEAVARFGSVAEQERMVLQG